MFIVIFIQKWLVIMENGNIYITHNKERNILYKDTALFSLKNTLWEKRKTCRT